MYSNEMKWNFKRLILSLYKFLVPKIESTENLIENRVRGWRRKMAQKIQFNHMMACALFYSYRVFHDEHSQFKYGKFVLNIQTTTSTLLMNASHHFISTKQKSQLPTKEKEKKKWKKRIVAKTHAVFIAKQKSSSLQIFCAVAIGSHTDTQHVHNKITITLQYLRRRDAIHSLIV